MNTRTHGGNIIIFPTYTRGEHISRGNTYHLTPGTGTVTCTYRVPRYVVDVATYSHVTATCIVYSYIVTAIGATTLTDCRYSEECVSSVRTPEIATPETASEERERRLQRRWEQARARRASEMAEYREERLRNLRVRDRARCTDQTAAETAEEREARLQATRDR